MQYTVAQRRPPLSERLYARAVALALAEATELSAVRELARLAQDDVIALARAKAHCETLLDGRHGGAPHLERALVLLGSAARTVAS